MKLLQIEENSVLNRSEKGKNNMWMVKMELKDKRGTQGKKTDR